MLHIKVSIHEFRIRLEINLRMLTLRWQSSSNLLHNFRRLQLVQFEHECADYDETDADDDGKDTNVQVVGFSFVLEFGDVVVEKLFLVR